MSGVKRLSLSRQQLVGIGGILIAAALWLAAVWYLPLGTEEYSVVRIEQAHEHVVVSAGTGLEQAFVSNQEVYRGAVVYSGSATLDGRSLELALLDDTGRILAADRSPEIYYLPDDTLVLRFEWPRVADQSGAALKARLTLLEGSPMLVSVSSPSDDAYRGGTLRINEQPVDRDLGLTMLVPSALAMPVKVGVTAGVITLLAAWLIWYVPHGRAQWLWCAVLLVAVTPLALGGFWFSDNPLGIADWDYYFSLHENYRQTVIQYGQFPFWDPWTCGGTAGLGDPEFPFFTLTFLLELIFGIPVGLRLAIFLSVAMTGLGMLVLGKRLGLPPLPALLAAIAASFSSVSLLELVEGHVNVLAAMWIPWVFFAWYGAYQMRSRRLPNRFSWRDLIWRKEVIMAGAFLALMFYAGGIYLLMYTGLAFLFLLILAPQHRAALEATLGSLVWALGLAALKLVPVLLWLKQFPDDAYASSTATWPYLYQIFLGRYLHGSYVLFAQDSGWHEYGAYIGVVVLMLALIGVAGYGKRRLVRALIVAAIAATLLSSAGPALERFFDVLWFFPRSNISRFVLFAVIPVSLLAGFGTMKLAGQRRSLLPVLLIGLVAVDVMSLSYQLSGQSFVLPNVLPAPAAAPAPIAFTSGRYDALGQGSRNTRTYAATLAGYGTTAYCSVLGPKPGVRLISDSGGDVYAASEDPKATVHLLTWSPNRVRVRVKAPAETKVTINTNYVNGWSVNGAPAAEFGNVVGTVVPAGQHEYEFVYRTPGFFIGWPVTLLSLVAAGRMFYGSRKRS